MKVTYRKKFLKELAKLPSAYRSKIEYYIFEELPQGNKTDILSKVDKLKGYRNYYKARFGDYRIGMKIENDEIVLERALHRKDIYNYFP